MSSTSTKTTKTNLFRSSLDRRQLLRAAGGGIGAAVVAGGPGRLAAARSRAAAQEAVTLPFWLPGGSPIFCETHTRIAADFTAANPGITVQVDCGTDQDTFTPKFLGSIAAGNPPEGSVLWDTPVSFGVNGALRPIDDLMAGGEFTPVENWPEGLLRSCQFGGQTYGLPYQAGSFAMWYNQEMLDAKGIPSDPASFPKTWDELRALSKEFTRWDGDRLVTAGFVPRPPDFTYTIPIWSALNGGQIYDTANQRYTIDSDENVAMMDYFIAWLDEEYKGDYAAVQRTGTWGAYPNDEGQPPQFQAGNLLAVEWGTWGIGDYYQYGEPKLEQWNLTSYPVGPGGSETTAGFWPNWIAIPAGSEYPEEAFAYLDYLSGIGALELFEVVPDLPTNAKVEAVVPEGLAPNLSREFVAEKLDFFRNQLAISTPMWTSPVEAFGADQLQQAAERIFAKQATPRDALAAAQAASQAELEKVLQGAA